MTTIIKYIFCLFWGCIAGWAIVTSNNFLLFVVVACLLFPLLFNKIKFVIYLMLISVFFLDWVWGYLSFIPRQFTWFPEILSMILLLQFLFDLASKRITVKNTVILWFLYAWVILMILGIIGNNVSSYVILAGIRNYFRFVPLFIVFSYYPFTDEFIKKVINAVIFVSLIQIMFVIPERIIFWGKSGDFVVGSLGANASGTLGIFQLLVFVLIISLYKSGYFSAKKTIVYSIITLLPVFIAEAKIVFFILPILIVLFLFDLRKRNLLLSMMISLVMLGVILIGGTIYNKVYTPVYGRTIQDFIFSPERIKDELGIDRISYGKAGELKRLSSVRFMFQNINKSKLTQLLGVGIGNASDSLFQSGKGYYSEKYDQLKIDGVFLSRFGWEYGYAGLVLMGLFLAVLYFLKPLGTDDTFINGVLLARKGLIIILLCTFVYNSFLIIPPLAIMFWLQMAILNRSLIGLDLKAKSGI